MFDESLSRSPREVCLLAANPIPNYKGGITMFWSEIMTGDETPLIPIRQTITGQRYVHLVVQPVIRLSLGGFGDYF